MVKNKIIKVSSVMIKNISNVVTRSCMASFLFPSKYHKIGRPSIRLPVKAAENTNSISINTGTSTVSSCDPMARGP